MICIRKSRGRPVIEHKTTEDQTTVYVSTSIFRAKMHEIIRKCNKGKNIILKAHGKNVAAVISLDDLDMLNGIKVGLEQIKTGKAVKHEEAWAILKEKFGLG